MNAAWISRPRRRATPLRHALLQNNLTPIVKPAMRIRAAKNRAFVRFLSHPNFFDMAIFVSEEAAHRCRNLLAARRVPTLAVGAATLAATEKIAGCAAIRAPAGDSDALLRLSHLRAAKIGGKKIALVGGVSGEDENSLSPRLRDGLLRRGAEVFCAVAYRRTPMPRDSEIASLLADDSLRAAVAYSGDTAANMLAMAAPQNARLRALPLFVIHPRIAAAAQKMGYRDLHIAPPDAEKMATQIAAHLRKFRK